MHSGLYACMQYKCSPEVSRGDSLWNVVVEWVGLVYRLVSVWRALRFYDTTLIVPKVLSLHRCEYMFMLLVMFIYVTGGSTTQH
jgi:hypothetical protein